MYGYDFLLSARIERLDRPAANRNIGVMGYLFRNTARSLEAYVWGAALLAVATLSPAVAAMLPGEQVIMQGLDKVTARVSTFEAPIDRVVSFGALRIVVRRCERTRPEEPPESSAFLDIYEARPGEPPADLFHGWMFASSPALSALEHPVYDVWVLECKVGAPADGEADGGDD
jgi:hypothetical protein